MASKLILLVLSVLILYALKEQSLFLKSKPSKNIPIDAVNKHAKKGESPTIVAKNSISTNVNVRIVEQLLSGVYHPLLQESKTKVTSESVTNDRARVMYGNDKPDAGFADESNSTLLFLHGMVKRADRNNVCYKYGTCKSNENYNFKTCYCDTDCTYYKDCCFDAERLENVTTEPEKFQYTECVNIDIPIAYGGGSNRGFYMVAKCPFEDRKCDQHENEIPVTDNNGVAYKNEHCAQCHGINHYRYWTIAITFDTCRLLEYTSIRTTKVSERIESLKQQKCSMYLIPPTALHENRINIPRSCIILAKEYFKKENNTLCDKYANPVYSVNLNVFIKNIFCLDTADFDHHVYACVKSINMYDSFYSEDTEVLPYTFVLFRFYTQQENSDQDCAVSKLWKVNQVVTGCAEETCNSSSVTKVCSEESVQNFLLRIPVNLQSYNVHSVPALERALLMYFLSLPINFYRIQLRSIYGKISCSEKIGLNEPNGCCVFRNVIITAFVRRKMKPKETSQLRSSILSMKFMYTERDYYSTNATYVENVLQGDNITCEIDNSYYNSIRTLINSEELKLFSNVLAFDTAPVLNYTEVPKLSDIKATIKQNQDLFIRDVNRDNLMFSLTVNDWVMVFSDKADNSTMAMTLNSTFTQTMITYITMAVSSAALLLTLGIFAYFEMYKLFAELISINMMIVVLLANLLFMTGIEAKKHDVLCALVGISLHYLWLCVFSWVILFSVLVNRMMVRLGRNESCDPEMECSKTSITLLGYGLPILIVVPSVILSYLQIESLQIRYNIDICFLTGFPANIIFLSGPLSLSLMINIIFLVTAFKKLSMFENNTLLRSTQITVMHIVPYIRLCLLSVILWIIGIILKALKHDILGYLFILVCGLQGLIVSLCFLTSTRVYRSVRLCREKKHLSRSAAVRRPNDIELN